ncbi:MAG TPA: alpha/beta hydrolase-fold protein [Vicinamibacterales bacterium]|nr:alpha/beta hydrolase-fold protein [Vicinamibacterales bacterium]
MLPGIRRIVIALALAVVAAAIGACASRLSADARLRVALSFPASISSTPLDGRMLLLLSTDGGQEPRFQITDNDRTQQVFGVDVDGLQPGQESLIDASVLGYPVASLSKVPAGEYWVQGLLHVYETFKRADGHVVKLPPDRGEGQQWTSAPGNLYSAPVKVRIDPGSATTVRVSLDKKIPPLADLPDSKYVKHVRIQSERLTKFWGRPMYLGAILVLPEGWDSHPDSRFPVAVFHGHFQREVFPWRESPPDPKLPAPDLAGIARYCPNGHEGELCTKYGYEAVLQEYGYALYKQWIGAGFPRVIMVNIQHANPYYDDSYAVNSENLGPYGDAITYELLPYIEKTFRGLGPWARGLYGGSTGGWEALAAQVFYPDQFNGTFANCPDPIDFRRFTNINIYEDRNAYAIEGPWRRTPRPGYRDFLGQTLSTVEQMNTRELVLGTKSRSGGQWDIWEAVYSPVGADGYPQRIWDKATGVIDPKVAAYWRDHYDLVHIMTRDWPTLGPKLRGKITLNAGLSDNVFLNNAVYLAEEFLKSATNPPAEATVDYGLRDEHCWSGDHEHVNAISRLTYSNRFIPKLAEHWQKTAPSGADTKSWRY